MLSEELIQKVLRQITKRTANHDYFFSKLSNPEWLKPLEEAELFSAPPPAIEENSMISFPFWPESQYLARVAGQAPNEVWEVMRKLPETNNVRVLSDLTEAAIAMPVDVAFQWARKMSKWVANQKRLHFSFLPKRLGELAINLVSSGRIEDGLNLLRVLLSIEIVDGPYKKVIAKFDSWCYEQILINSVPSIIKHAKIVGLELLCKILKKAAMAESEEETSCKSSDYSFVWRPAIESGENSGSKSDIRNLLVDAVRDVSIQLITAIEKRRSITDLLISFDLPVFKRIAIHLATEVDDFQLASIMLFDFQFFYNPSLSHEYNCLLKKIFSRLRAEEKEKILAWIKKGPFQEDGEREYQLSQNEKEYWQVKRLFWLRGQLSKDWDSYYLNLSRKFDVVDESDSFYSKSELWVGPTSPKSAEELSDMTANEIASFLKKWVSPNDWNSASPQGLGRVLQTVVAKIPDRFAENLNLFQGIHQTYAGAIIDGLSEVLKKGDKLNCVDVIAFLKWVAKQPRGGIVGDGRFSDPHWGWARKSCVRFLSTAFERELLSVDLREVVWQIIEIISEDPDPIFKNSESSSMDPITESINTTRGEAMHCVVRYALWVRRSLVGKDNAFGKDSFSMNLIPEVKETLEKHLNATIDSSPAIRAVYGQWLPWLYLIDSNWVKANMENIFPKENKELKNSAWYTYLRFCAVYNELFFTLESLYRDTIDDFDNVSAGDATLSSHIIEKIGEHLMVMFGRGLIAWDDENSILKSFFNKVSPDFGNYTIEFVGRSLCNESKSLSNEVVDRFKTFWEKLLLYVKECPDKFKILNPFAWWFVSGRFEEIWALGQLLQILQLGEKVEPEYRVIEYLASGVAERETKTSLKVLRALVNNDKHGWAFSGIEENVHRILEAGFKNELTKSEAVAIAHILGARGYFKFRDLF